MSPGRLEDLARELARREAIRLPDREKAHRLALDLRAGLERARERFAEAAGDAGAPHLGGLLMVGPVEPDDKSVRAFQIRVRRGRHEGIVVSKDRGEVMLVGPFRRGEEQGPCNPIQLRGDQLADDGAMEAALEGFLASLVEQSFAK